jgi:rod shape-determining protein MreC
MELRFIAANADVAVGDILTTSGIDGIYPSSLLVAKVEFIERRADSGFAKIRCKPLANAMAVRHVLILKPISNPQQDLAADEAEAIAEANALSVASAASSASSSNTKKGPHKC